MSVRTCAFAVIILLVLALPNAFAQTRLPGDLFTESVKCVNNSNAPDTIEAQIRDYGHMTVVPVSAVIPLNLYPGHSQTYTFKITVPSGTAPGTYTVVFECESLFLGAPSVHHNAVVEVGAAPTSGGGGGWGGSLW